MILLYEGRYINKLQNNIILLIFKIWKFGSICFVGNLIREIYWNFYDYVVITVTSLVPRTQSVSAVFCPAVFFLATHKCWTALWVKQETEQVQQANVFKRQTLMFSSTYRPNSCKHLSHHTPVWLHDGIDRCDRCIGRWNHTATRLFLISNTFSTMNKLFTPNMYCWSSKILVTIYWAHLRLDGICTKSFCPQHTNNRRLFVVGWFQRQRVIAISNVYKWRHSDVIVIKLSS